jgi:hypothetical protein
MIEVRDSSGLKKNCNHWIATRPIAIGYADLGLLVQHIILMCKLTRASTCLTNMVMDSDRVWCSHCAPKGCWVIFGQGEDNGVRVLADS